MCAVGMTTKERKEALRSIISDVCRLYGLNWNQAIKEIRREVQEFKEST